MTHTYDSLMTAIQDLQQGKMIILTDDCSRENEGDLIIPAENITTDQMNFMIRHGSGIVCLSLTADHLKKLNLPLMVPAQENTSMRGTPFTISIDAKQGIATGVSAADRTHTIKIAISDPVQPDDLVKPGHIFPLQAHDNGVLARAGHTEGAIDLVKLAGFKPAAALCEIMNPDGTMAQGDQLIQFANTHGLTILSIHDLIAYRQQQEKFIFTETSANIPLKNYGSFIITILKEQTTNQEILVLTKQDNQVSQLPTLVRIHSACTTGDLFASLRCDCNKQLHYALERMSKEGGILIYLPQEGRGIGLFNKIKTYALQEQGLDTVEANEKLGLPPDSRQYDLAASILKRLHINSIRLMTNNPNKINELSHCGLTIQREPMPVFQDAHNQHYLQTKKEKLFHMIHME